MSHNATKKPARIYFAMMLTSRKISLSVTINRLIFFLKKIPLVGKIVPESLYGEYEGKLGLVVLANMYRLFKRLFMKALYLGCIFASCLWAIGVSDAATDKSFSMSAINADHALFFFFFFSYIGAGLAYGKAMNLDVALDLMIIEKLRADSAIYIPARIFERKIIDLFATLPFAILLSFSAKYTIIEAILIVLMMSMSKMALEGAYLILFDRLPLAQKRIRIFFNVTITIFAIAVFVLPYVLIILGRTFLVKSLVLNPLFMIGITAAAVASIFYVLRFHKYRELAWASVVNYNLAIEKNRNVTKEKNFGIVKNAIDKDIDAADIQQSLSHLSGYAYFNRIFAFRHRKYFKKHMALRAIGIAVAFIAYVAVTTFVRLFSGPLNPVASERNFHILPLCFGIFYFLSLGRSATAAMFRSCDSAMLTYPFYRESKAVLHSFYHRFKTILYYNLPTYIGILVVSVAFDIFGNFFEQGASLSSINYLKLIPYLIASTMIWMFFSFHDLFIYYIIQPYTSELGVKSKIFSIVQGVVYYIAWMNLQMSNVNITIYMSVLIAATIAYVFIGLFCINKFSAKTFRLK